MPEPRLEEDNNEQEKTTKKASNPLASILKKKVKIFGREIPMPLIILGALGIGIVIFTLIGKKGGGRSDNAEQEETSDIGFSEQPQNLGEFAQNGANTSIDEMQSDLGSVLPIEPLPSDSFSPMPLSSYDISPLPTPELPYSSGFADSFGTLPSFGAQYPAQVPYEQVPIVQYNQPTAPSEQPPLSPRFATGKVRAIASETPAPVIRSPFKALPVKKPAKATPKPVANPQPVRLPTPPPKTILPPVRPPAKATPKPVINPQPVRLPTPPSKTLPMPQLPIVPSKPVPKKLPSSGNKGVKNR